MPSTLTFAHHVGLVSAATSTADLLCISLSAGVRGAHRVLVVDVARSFAPVVSFEVEGHARSGGVGVQACGDLLIVADDVSLSAHRAATGERVWRLDFPDGVTLVDTCEPWLLVSLGAGPQQRPITRLMRARDGALDAAFPEVNAVVGLACVRADGSVANVIGSSPVYLTARNGPRSAIDVPWKSHSTRDVMEFDDTGTRVCIGGRDGEVVVVDLESGAHRRVFELASIRSVGFVEGRPWAIDREGRVRIASNSGGEATAVDLSFETGGGFLIGAAAVALNHSPTGQLRVIALDTQRPLYATSTGVQCKSVGIAETGEIFVGTAQAVFRIDPKTCTGQKLASSNTLLIARGAGGAVLFLRGSSASIFAPDDDKPVKLGNAHHQFAISAEGTRGAFVSDRTIDLWDLSSRARIESVDLSKTDPGHAGEHVLAAFFTREGGLLVAWSSGEVFALDDLRARRPPVHRFPRDSHLAMAPGGDWLFRIDGRTLQRTSMREGAANGSAAGPTPPALTSGLDADISSVIFSPSGKRLAVLHRNGRLALLDLEAETSAVVDRPETSAALLAPGEMYLKDLGPPLSCAFSRDERRALWVTSGTLTFAEVATGRIVGQMVLTAGGGCAATDGVSFDWAAGTKAKKPTPLSNDVEARVDGARLSPEDVASRRRPGLLQALV